MCTQGPFWPGILSSSLAAFPLISLGAPSGEHIVLLHTSWLCSHFLLWSRPLLLIHWSNSYSPFRNQPKHSLCKVLDGKCLYAGLLLYLPPQALFQSLSHVVLCLLVNFYNRLYASLGKELCLYIPRIQLSAWHIVSDRSIPCLILQTYLKPIYPWLITLKAHCSSCSPQRSGSQLGEILPPKGIWQCRETFLVVQLGGCYWHAVSRG